MKRVIKQVQYNFLTITRTTLHTQQNLHSRQFSVETEATTTSNATKLLYLAPVIASGAIVASVLFYISIPAQNPTKELTGVTTAAPTEITSLTNSQQVPEQKPSLLRQHQREIITPSNDDTSILPIWSIGEKVDREQLKARYAIKTSDSRKGKLQVIGRGAYGRVLSATSKGETGTVNVAIKVVSPQQMSAQALAREVEILRRVRGHDNIIHLLEVLECNGEWYLVTELCEGGDLLDRMITNGPYDEETCAAVIFNVASAIDHVHRCGFVHCDIKPENLVFVSKGGTRRDLNASDVRLIDFGMAKDLVSIDKLGGLLLRTASSTPGVISNKSGTTVAPPSTAISPRVGTVAYWAPEQVHAGNATLLPGKKEELLKSDPRACDVWALGVIMYIMLYGCHPFDIKGEGDMKKIAEEIISKPARFDLHGDRVVLSQDAQEVLSALLEPNPEKRMKLGDLMNHRFFATQKARKHGIEVVKATSSTSEPSMVRKRTLDRLPTSWKQAGYQPKRAAADDAIEDPINAHRLMPFRTLEANQALVQALLLAAVATAEEDEEEYRTSDALFRAAFHVLDHQSLGVLTEESINLFVKTMKQGTAESGHGFGQAMERAALRISSSPPNEEKLPEHYLTYDEFEALLRSNLCVSRNFEKGQVVFEQGAIPQGVYLLTKGQAKVEWHPPDTFSHEMKSPKSQIIEDGFAAIPPGSIIGETAIVQGRLNRSATIRLTEDSQVVYIPKQEFLLAVSSSKALHEKIFALTNEQQARRVFQLVDKLKEGKLVTFQEGQTIFKQGDPADSLYLVRSGSVELTVRGQADKNANEIHVRVGRRRQGDVVGVSAVNSQGKRSTSATCLEKVQAIRIDSEDLKELLQQYPILKFYIESQKRWRNENWQKMLSSVQRGVSEPQILPMLGEGVEEDAGKSFEEYQKALTRAPIQNYRAGEYIFRRGAKSGYLYVIESGRCDVELVNANGKVMSITQLGPGDHIGEQALLDGRPHFSFSVRCVTPVEVRALTEKQFFHLLGDRGASNFARAVRVAMRERRHRWVCNMLQLAHDTGEETRIIHVNADESLFKVGEPVDRLMYVHRGSFILTRPDGSVLKTITAGDTIGWEVFKEGGAISSANVICVTKAVVEAIPKKSLDNMIENHRYVSKELEHAASTFVPEFSSSLVKRRSFRN